MFYIGFYILHFNRWVIFNVKRSRKYYMMIERFISVAILVIYFLDRFTQHKKYSLENFS